MKYYNYYISKTKNVDKKNSHFFSKIRKYNKLLKVPMIPSYYMSKEKKKTFAVNNQNKTSLFSKKFFIFK